MEETSTKLKDLELLQNSVNSTQIPGRRGARGMEKTNPCRQSKEGKHCTESV